MAFDQPIEADRVDDLNLFSVFLRAPVIGSLMWILSGDTAKEEEETERRLEELLETNDKPTTYPLKPSIKHGLPIRPALKRDASGSLSSDVDECRQAMHRIDLSELVQQGGIDGNETKRTKKSLSWSDEIGHDLVSYMENESTNNTQLAMTRSRGGKADMLKEFQPEHRYLPKGLDRAHNGIIMPTRPYGSNSATTSGGEASPQWGWYINMTPPTPEMYQCRSLSQSPKKQQIISDGLPSIKSEGIINAHSAAPLAEFGQPNKVFEDLQKRNREKQIGWSTGVPL